MSSDPERLSALFEEFLEYLYDLQEPPWSDAEYPADNYEIHEDWWILLEEVFPEPLAGIC